MQGKLGNLTMEHPGRPYDRRWPGIHALSPTAPDHIPQRTGVCPTPRSRSPQPALASASAAQARRSAAKRQNVEDADSKNYARRLDASSESAAVRQIYTSLSRPASAEDRYHSAQEAGQSSERAGFTARISRGIAELGGGGLMGMRRRPPPSMRTADSSAGVSAFKANDDCPCRSRKLSTERRLSSRTVRSLASGQQSWSVVRERPEPPIRRCYSQRRRSDQYGDAREPIAGDAGPAISCVASPPPEQ